MSAKTHADPPLAEIQNAQAGDMQARARVMAAIDPFLKSVVRRWNPVGLEFEDACQDARLAVLTDLKYFNPDRFEFSGWTALTIRQQFRNWIRDSRRDCRAIWKVTDSLEGTEGVSSRAHACSHNPYPHATDRIFIAQCRRAVPANPLTRLSLDLYMAGKNLAEESRRRSLPEDGLGQRFRTWVRGVRFYLGLDPRPPHSQRRPRSAEAKRKNAERQHRYQQIRRAAVRQEAAR